MNVMSQGKSEYWQAIRGICILAVIMIHCPTGQEYSINETYAWLVLRQIINFPVALFIFMAGYFVNTDKVEHGTRTYVLNRGGATPNSIFGMEYALSDERFADKWRDNC